MSKRLPDTRRDSMVSHFSGGSANDTHSPLPPPPPTFSIQPHPYQQVMAAQAPTPSMHHQPGRRYTQQEIQELGYAHNYQAFVRTQAQLNPNPSQHLRSIQEQPRLAGQNRYLPGAPPVNPQAFAQQQAYHNGQSASYLAQSLPLGPPSSQLYPDSTYPYNPQTHSLQGNDYLGRNNISLGNTHTTNGHDLSTRDMQDMARASPNVSHPNISSGFHRAVAAQQGLSLAINPYFSTTGSVPSPKPTQLMGQAPTPRLPTSTATPSSAPIPPQYAGTKRGNPSGHDSYAEGSAPKKAMHQAAPVPKIGLFTTAPPSRPNSAQGNVAPLQKKRPSQTGTVKLGRPKKEGPATKKAGNGAKISTGAPSRPAATTSQMQRPQVIDLTGEEQPPQQQPQPSHTQPPLTTQAPQPAVVEPARISKRATSAKKNPRQHALRHGLHMSTVELATNMQACMQAWLSHHEDLAAAQSLLDPSPTLLQRLRRENANATSNHGATNTIDTAHAAALGLPTGFNMQATLNTVRHPSFDYAYSGHASNELEPASSEAIGMCTRDADGSLRAPEEKEGEMSEQGAILAWELAMLAAEKGGRRASRWASSAKGKASWR